MVPEEKKMGKKSVAICKDEKELFDITLVGFSPCISCFSFFSIFFLSFFLWLLFLFFLSKSIPIRRGFSYFLSSCFCFAPFPPFFYYYFFFLPPIFLPPSPFSTLFVVFFLTSTRLAEQQHLSAHLPSLRFFSFFLRFITRSFPVFFSFPNFFLFFLEKIERAKEQQRRTEK